MTKISVVRKREKARLVGVALNRAKERDVAAIERRLKKSLAHVVRVERKLARSVQDSAERVMRDFAAVDHAQKTFEERSHFAIGCVAALGALDVFPMPWCERKHPHLVTAPAAS